MRIAMIMAHRICLYVFMVGAHTHDLNYLEPLESIVYCCLVGKLCLKCFRLLLTEEITQVEDEPRPCVANAIVRPPDPPIAMLRSVLRRSGGTSRTEKILQVVYERIMPHH